MHIFIHFLPYMFSETLTHPCLIKCELLCSQSKYFILKLMCHCLLLGLDSKPGVSVCVYMRTLRLPLFDASLCLECNCCCFFICPSQCALKVFLNSKSWTHTNLTHRISPFILFAMFLTFIRLSSFLSFPFLLCFHYTLWATLMLPALMLSLLLLLTFYHKMVGNAEVIV